MRIPHGLIVLLVAVCIGLAVYLAAPRPAPERLSKGPAATLSPPAVGVAAAAPAAVAAPAGGAQAPARRGFEKLTYATNWASERKPEFAAFNDWARRYLRSDRSAAIAAEGIARGERRLEALADLIEFDPAEAIASAIPAAVRRQLPPGVPMEERVAGRGDFSALFVVPAPGVPVEKPVLRELRLGGRRLEAFVYGRRAHQTTKYAVPLHGIAVGKRAALHESPVRVLEAGEVPDPAKPLTQVCPISGRQTPLAAPAEPVNLTEPLVAEVGDKTVSFCDPAHIHELAATLADGEAGPSPHVSAAPPLLASSWTEGQQDVLVIRVDFPDLAGDPVIPWENTPITQAFALSRMNSEVDPFFRETSFHKTSLNTTVTSQLYRMPQTANYYATNGVSHELMDDAKDAVAASYTLSDFDRFIVVFSNLGSIPGSRITYGGLGGGSNAWINGYFDQGVVVHELGHTYGLPHANLWRVSDGNPLSSGGSSIEYGDIFDTMGSSSSHGQFNHSFKHRMNWMTDANVRTVTTSGTYRVHRFDDAAATGVLALKIARDSSHSYWVGLRKKFPMHATIDHGAYILWGYTDGRQSALLDLNTPGDSASDAGLKVGATLSDAVAGIHMTPVAESGSAPNEALDVVVNLGAFPGNGPPSASIGVPAGARTNRPALFTAAATDPNGDALAYLWDFGDGLPNQSTATRTQVWEVGGTYAVTCTVSDMKGGKMVATASVTVDDPLLTWTARPSGTTRPLYAVAALGSTQVAVGSGVIVRSTGGSFATQNAGLNINLYDVCAGAAQFVAVGMDYDWGLGRWISDVRTSDDGSAWTTRTVPKLGALQSVAHGNGIFVAVGDDGTILTSPDGATWTSRNSGTTADLSGVTFGAAGFIAVGAVGTILRSTDGIVWYDLSEGSSSLFEDVAFGGGLYVAVGWDAVYSSPDGVTWTSRENDPFYLLRAVTYANGQFLAIGTKADAGSGSDVTLGSRDGATWWERPITAAGDLRGIIGVGSAFVAVGEQGTILQSGATGVPVITSAGSVSANQGTSFTYQITASDAPASYGATGLPAGLTIDAATGLISGTPTALGSAHLALTATNANGTGSATLVLTVHPPGPLITSAPAATAVQGHAFNYQITASDFPISFGATGLPAGLGINSTTGLISGTPSGTGSFMVTLSATNAIGTGTAPLALTVNSPAPVITSTDRATAIYFENFSYQITATNAPASFGASGLPPGLSVNTATGVIFGTPTSYGTWPVTLSAHNVAGTGVLSLSLTINPPTPVITSAQHAIGIEGSAFTTYRIEATNYAETFGASGLPPGLSVNAGSGDITGIPTAAGTYNASVTASNVTGTGSLAVTFTIRPPVPVITSAGSASGIIGAAFGYQIAATGSPATFDATGLPAGLGINTANGLISGVPAATGTFSVVLSATNGTGTGTRTLALTIHPPAPVITSAGSAAGMAGAPFTYQIAATNNPVSFGATGLPAGLGVNSATGLISGTPAAAGTFNASITATNGGGTGALGVTLTIRIPPPEITSAPSAPGVRGSAFSYQIAASNSPASYGATGLPAGLSIDTVTGLISGAPSAAGDVVASISATNESGTGSARLDLQIDDTAGGRSGGSDSFLTATPLAGSTVRVRGSNVAATSELGEPPHGGFEAEKSIWWKWTAPHAGEVEVTTAGSDFDTVLAVYDDAASFAAFAQYHSNDNTSAKVRTSTVRFSAVAGQAYFIAVDGVGGASGEVLLTIRYALTTSYHGVLEPAEPASAPVGFVAVTVTANWSFSGSIFLKGQKAAIRGAFDATGGARRDVKIRGERPLATLQLDVTDGTDTLSVAVDGARAGFGATARRSSYHPKTNPFAAAGNFTLLLEPGTLAAGKPQGAGFGTLKIDQAGSVAVTATLGDGVKASQKTRIADDGTWPFFAAPYRQGGSISGLCAVDGGGPMSGALRWIKLRVSKGLYPGGFDAAATLTGGRYVPPLGSEMILSVPPGSGNAHLEIVGGDLPAFVPAKSVTLLARNKVISATGERFRMSINVRRGVFSGSFLDPTSGAMKPFSGAIHRGENRGAGLFKSSTATGRVTFGASP